MLVHADNFIEVVDEANAVLRTIQIRSDEIGSDEDIFVPTCLLHRFHKKLTLNIHDEKISQLF